MMAGTLGKSPTLSEPQSCNLPNENDTCPTYFCELSHRHEIQFTKCRILQGHRILTVTHITVPTGPQPSPRMSLC